MDSNRRKGIVPATNIYPPNERLPVQLKESLLNEASPLEQDCPSTSITDDFEAVLAGLTQESRAMTHEVVNSAQGEVTLPDFVLWNPDQFSAEQWEALSAKGAMSLPESRVLDVLLESYIDFVHPQLAFLDPSKFLFAIRSNGQSSQLSLLLLYAVLFAGALYTDISTHCGNLRELKRTLRTRAKVRETQWHYRFLRTPVTDISKGSLRGWLRERQVESHASKPASIPRSLH